MSDRPRLGAHGALYLRPLLRGLDRPESPFGLTIDHPASIALQFRDRPEELRGAFLSPIDYARQGGDYRIVPGICAASSIASGTVQLFIKPEKTRIDSVAVDVRVTSEILLAKIILAERFPNLPSEQKDTQYLPMLPDLEAMLGKADAALVVNDTPPPVVSDAVFSLDLVEEWHDLTGLPYVHGFWTVREDDLSKNQMDALTAARNEGIRTIPELSHQLASRTELPKDKYLSYFSLFSYELGADEEAGLSEFIRYAFYHGAIKDIPEIKYALPEKSG